MPKSLLMLIGAGGLLAIGLVLALFAARPQPLPAPPAPDIGVAGQELSPQAQLTPETTGVPVPSPSAAEPPSAVAATPVAALPERRPYTPLFFDDFSQITSGWTPLFVDAQGTANGYSAESFAFSTATPGRLLFNILPRLSLTPTRYSVELLPVEGSGMFGLMLEVRGDPADYNGLAFYGVGLNTDGDVMLLVKGAGTELEVLPVADGLIVPRPLEEPNRLRVDRFGDSLTVRLDDAEAITVATPPPEGGTVGFFALADDRLAVRFDNLLLTAGAPAPEAPCAQLRPLFHDLAPDAAVAGEDVALVQRRLAQLGYAPGAGAVYSAETANAVAQFQTRNRLAANGTVDAQTWCRLLSGSAVLAARDASERAAMGGRYRPVAIRQEAELPAPLFVSVRGDDRLWQIALALPGRTGLHYIDTGGDALDPAWLPGQGLLAFSSVRASDGKEAIWILNTLNGQLTRVSPPSLDGMYPSWSPDGRALMFTGQVDAEENTKTRNYLYTLSDKRVTPWGGEPAGWSDWSPVGTVVFTRWTGRSFDIFVASADGTGEVNLTNTDDYHEDIPAWSPAGDQIAFVRNPRSDPDDRQLYLMQADGSEVRAITSMPGPNSNPIWLDSTTIAFAHQPSDEVRQPYLLRLPGDLRQLSASAERVWFMQRFGPGS